MYLDDNTDVKLVLVAAVALGIIEAGIRHEVGCTRVDDLGFVAARDSLKAIVDSNADGERLGGFYDRLDAEFEELIWEIIKDLDEEAVISSRDWGVGEVVVFAFRHLSANACDAVEVLTE